MENGPSTEKTEMKESIEWKRFLVRMCASYSLWQQYAGTRSPVYLFPSLSLSLSLSRARSADSEHVLQAIIM